MSLESKLAFLAENAPSWRALKEHFCTGRMVHVPGEWIRDAWIRFFADAKAGRIPGHAVLYVHLPYCQRRCSYCQANAMALPAREAQRAYLDLLHTEIATMGDLAGDHPFSAGFVGGGTPSLLSAQEIDDLLTALFARFRRTEDFHFSFETSPNTLTEAKLEVLRRHGCNRVPLGVESMNPAVLKAINRGHQTAEHVTRAFRLIRAAGIPSINVDMMAGLPEETPESFADGLRQVLALGPNTVTVFKWLYHYADLYRDGLVDEAAACAARDEQFEIAGRLLRELRTPIRVSSQILSDDFYYTFERDDTSVYGILKEEYAAAVLGLGRGAESRIPGTAYMVGEEGWEEAVKEGRLAGRKTQMMTRHYELANVLTHQLQRKPVSCAAFAETFGVSPREVFGPELAYLSERGFVQETDGMLVPNLTVPEDELVVALMVLFSEDDLRNGIGTAVGYEATDEVREPAAPSPPPGEAPAPPAPVPPPVRALAARLRRTLSQLEGQWSPLLGGYRLARMGARDGALVLEWRSGDHTFEALVSSERPEEPAFARVGPFRVWHRGPAAKAPREMRQVLELLVQLIRTV